MMNNMMNNMGQYNYMGMNAPQAVPKFNNVLTPEEINTLRQQGSNFTLSLTADEMLRSVCNHRNAEGTGDALVYDPVDGVARCTICGYSFKPVDPDVKIEDIKEACATIVDMLQTIKLMYIDLPGNAAKEYFPIIPMIEKIPQLFEFAAKNMTKHEVNGWMYNNRNMGAVNMFNNLQNMFAGGFNPMMQPQQPMMGGFNPAMNGQPVYQAPNGMVSNGFGYAGANMNQPNPAFASPAFGMQQGGYAPQTNGFQYTPGMVQQQPMMNAPVPTAAPMVTPEAPKADGTATVTQTVSV